MRLAIAGVLGLLVTSPQAPRAHHLTFDADRAGAAPAGFELAAMRQSDPGVWLIRRDATNGMLAHTGNEKLSGFSLALAPEVSEGDMVASVRVRLGVGRAGGLVWRFADAANFYAVVLDLADRELSLFRVTAGNRVFLESIDDLELDPAAWHTLKVVHDDEEIRVSLGGIRVFEDRERRSDRRRAGRTGVIARGASDAWFDDLRVETLRGR